MALTTTWTITFSGATGTVMSSSEGSFEFSRGQFRRKSIAKSYPIGDYGTVVNNGKEMATHTLSLNYLKKNSELATLYTLIASVDNGTSQTMTLPSTYGTFSNCFVTGIEESGRTEGFLWNASTLQYDAAVSITFTISILQTRP